VIRAFLVFSFFFMIVGCTKQSTTPSGAASSSEAAPSPEALAEKGKTLFQTNCTACHNPDPTKDGSLGPAIAGSSLELVQARLSEAGYPAGYKPKRDTHVMPKLPFLLKDAPALVAYLNSVK